MLTALLLAFTLVATPQAATPQASTDERSIFDAVLKDLLGKELPGALLIESTPRAFNYVGEFDWKKFGPTPDALSPKLKTLSTVPFTVDAFPKGAQLIAQQDLMELFSPKNRDFDEAWTIVRTKYKVQSTQAFSRPVITDDGLDAYVMYSHGCGMLCGQYGYAWLHRTSRSDSWVVKRFVKIVS